MMTWEDYLYSNGVLKNKLNIQDFNKLQKVEYAISQNAEDDLYIKPATGELNFSLLKQIHRGLFGDLYDWAGQIRQVEIRKSTDDPFFTSVSQIESQANSLFYSVKRDNFFQNCHSKEEFINKSADFLNRLNTIHPFREGNGRAQKLFMNYLAVINGYFFNYDKISKDDWNKAFEGSLHSGFYDRIAKALNQIVEPINDLELVNLYRRSFNLNEIKEVKKEILTKDFLDQIEKIFEQYPGKITKTDKSIAIINDKCTISVEKGNNERFPYSVNANYNRYEGCGSPCKNFSEVVKDLDCVFARYGSHFGLKVERKALVPDKEQPKNEEKDENNEVSDIEEGLEL